MAGRSQASWPKSVGACYHAAATLEVARVAILDYCNVDVTALERLLPAMLPRLDLPRALLRGRFMRAASAVEWHGTPIDTDTLAALRRHWTGIQDELIASIDRDYGVSSRMAALPQGWRPSALV